ncbi:MAG: DUF2092 domain-containing protein [Candidatus Scalindua sediminis]
MPRDKNHIKILAVVSITLLLCWSACSNVIRAEESKTSEAEDTPVVGPRTDKLLRAMGEYLKTAKQFSFHAEITFDDMLPSGQKIQYSASNDIAVHRPDRVYAESQRDQGNMRFWYDGKNITLQNDGIGVYAKVPVPAIIDAAMDHLMDKYGFSPPLVDFIYQDPYNTLIENVEFGFYVGLHNVVGIRCHHLAFVQKNIDWQIWIEDGKQMVPRKLTITYKNEPESPQFTAVLSEWDLDARLPKALFNANLTSTANFEKIEFLDITKEIPSKLGEGE